MSGNTSLFVLILLLQFICLSWQQTQDQIEQGKSLSELVAWFPKANIKIYKIQVSNIPGFGNSVKAMETIEKGELFMSVPFSSMILPTNPLDEIMQRVKLIPLIGSNPTHITAIQLLYEKNKKDSFWKFYIATLPKEFSTTLYFTEEELNVLEGSKLKGYTQQRARALQRNYERIIEVLEDKFPQYFNRELYSFEEFKWAVSAIWSRAFNFKLDGTGGLVPMADMFNSIDGQSGETLLKVETRLTENELQYFALETIPAGEQIFTPYGKHKRLSNAQLLLDYGFVVIGNKNEMGVFDNPISESDAYYDQKVKFLQAGNLWRPQYNVYKDDISEVLAPFRISNIIPSEFSMVDRAFEGKGNRISDRNEKATVRQLISVVNRMLSLYPTTIEKDVEILKTLSLAPSNRNLRAAIIVRKGEKEILQEFKLTLEKLRQQLYK